MARIKFYHDRFVVLYNEHRLAEDIDELKFMRILNVEIASFQARWPSEKELNDEAVARFIQNLNQARAKARKKKKIKRYGPKNTPPR